MPEYKTVKPKPVEEEPVVEETKVEKAAEKPKEITLADMARQNKIIEENNKKAGIVKPHMARARDARTLPIANK